MEKTFQTLEFDKILNKLEELALTEIAKKRIRNLQIYLSEDELKARMNETTEAKRVLEEVGTPALVSMKDIRNSKQRWHANCRRIRVYRYNVKVNK